ncbi:MAG TPA: DUF2330 domain-containing protein, partial [Vicinamibacteria bacterium]
MAHRVRRLVRAGVVALLLARALAAAPAGACGCGAYVPREGAARVGQERALLRWDGRAEDLVLELSVEGRSAEAAWILPVPAPATVRLADPRLFDALQELTRPQVRTERVRPGQAPAGGAPGGAPAVTLLARQALGPFDVSTLAARDAGALEDWLAANGYRLPAGLGEVLRAYVERGWYYVAARLLPGAGGQGLGGRLDPLWVSFASPELVYPMRPSALARGALALELYVLAEHRVEAPRSFRPTPAEGPDRRLTLRYAGWVEPAALDPASPHAPLVPRRLFLTRFELRIGTPATFADDFVLPVAAEDGTYRETEVRYVVEAGGGAARPWALGGIALAAGVALGAALAWRVRRRRPRG